MIQYSHLSEKVLFVILILKSHDLSVMVYRHMVVVISILLDDSLGLNYPLNYLETEKMRVIVLGVF